MAGKSKGRREEIVTLAHQTELMARQKVLRRVDHYLGRPLADKKSEGVSSVLALFRRIKAHQDSQQFGQGAR